MEALSFLAEATMCPAVRAAQVAEEATAESILRIRAAADRKAATNCQGLVPRTEAWLILEQETSCPAWEPRIGAAAALVEDPRYRVKEPKPAMVVALVPATLPQAGAVQTVTIPKAVVAELERSKRPAVAMTMAALGPVTTKEAEAMARIPEAVAET